MKTYSQNKSIEIMESAKVPRGLSHFEEIKVLLWGIFNHRKFYKFIEGIEKGYSLPFAIRYAKNKN
jgi:hypothetical protein